MAKYNKINSKTLTSLASMNEAFPNTCEVL